MRSIVLGIIANQTTEQVLLYLQNYGEGHARGIAATFGISLSAVQRQLIRLEESGVIVSQMKGRTRLFTWNPRYPLKPELSALLERVLALTPKASKEQWFLKRVRPRRSGKPL